MVGIIVGPRYYEIGSGSFLHSFFSTVCIRLEEGKWGTRFPTLMNGLYEGQLENSDVLEAKKELQIVRDELSDFPPNNVVWDRDDLNARPPWGNNISKDITDLSNYFVTSDGKDLITVMLRAFADAESSGENIMIG